MNRSHLLTALLLALLASACSEAAAPTPAETPAEAGPLDVAVVHHPLAVLAQRLGGDAVVVDFPAAGEGDPAFWSPDPSIMPRFQQADLVLLNGAGYSRWVQTAPLPRSRLVDTTATRADDLIEMTDRVTHSHGTGGEHSHAGTAFTTWLDLDLAADQAKVVAAAISNARPDLDDAVDQRLAALVTELSGLAARLDACLDDRPVVGSHPVYQYLARRHGLSLRSVHWEPDTAPDEQQWAELDALLAEHPATLMLWEGEPLPEVVAALRQRGLESVVVSPCSQAPAEGDWLTVTAAWVEALCRAYAG